MPARLDLGPLAWLATGGGALSHVGGADALVPPAVGLTLLPHFLGISRLSTNSAVSYEKGTSRPQLLPGGIAPGPL